MHVLDAQPPAKVGHHQLNASALQKLRGVWCTGAKGLEVCQQTHLRTGVCAADGAATCAGHDQLTAGALWKRSDAWKVGWVGGWVGGVQEEMVHQHVRKGRWGEGVETKGSATV
jgi:hypothetical protein